MLRYVVLLCAALLAGAVEAGEPDLGRLQTQGKLADAQQLVVVTPRGGIHASASGYEYRPAEKRWVRVLGPFDAVLGSHGFAAPNEKHEGDGRTPSGVYPLGDAFGYAAALDTRLHYRQSGSEDFWVDDVNSPNYNRWVHGNPNAKSFEKMRRPDDLYSAGVIVEYNTSPIIKGAGSAIFMHVWRRPDRPTAGCVAMAHENMLSLLRWLDPARKPTAVLNPQALH
jgi:L,D-peptidoglycan transpeptidase YkuD (ErfK/YbiS/YcfS/YnhG family)